MTYANIRVGQGIDIHEFSNSIEDNTNLILAGINIPYKKGLKGHSDADVVLHALVDSLLGALAMGDIGEHFPPSDTKWKGANSSIFVSFVKELLQSYKAIIYNIDVTILAQEPKLYDFKKSMQNNIAHLLEIEITQVNIKASTTEHLGFVGRKEGIFVSVISLIALP